MCASKDKELGGKVAELTDVYGAILLLSAGLLVGALCLMIEIFIERCSRYFVIIARQLRLRKRSGVLKYIE